MRLIHPFHPRNGEVFEFLERMKSWRGDVVLVRMWRAVAARSRWSGLMSRRSMCSW
ncbi:DUF5372 family protein [Streptomyces mirabilis]